MTEPDTNTPSPHPLPRFRGRGSSYAHLIVALFTLFGIACAVATADVANPPDMTRFVRVSPEVVDRNGVLLRAYLTDDGYWRMKTTVADVSPRYLAMLKAYEDKRFEEHWGVDLLAVVRAGAQFVGAGHIISGGSTLTMQVARILEPPKQRGILTKLFQMMRAVQLEERYTKDEILSMYLTLAPFGGNLEGVRAASLSYYGKPPNQIDLAEAALLVALPQSPVKQRPDRHAIRAAKGRDKVLARMVGDGIITEDDAALARREGVPFARQAMPLTAPHLATRLKLRNPHATRIVTTIDANIQGALERLAAQEQPYFGDGTSLSIVVVENRTRNVVAYLGGVNYWGSSGQVDLAQRSRSPGSTLKPFIYGMAFDGLMLHPASLMMDAPTMFGDYAPKDFEGTFQGAISAQDALRASLNIPAVMALDRIGPLTFTSMLERAGAKLAFPAGGEAPSLPVALGGLGISLADLTMLYTGIANDGTARALRYLKSDPEGADHAMFGAVPAFYLRQILRGVALPDGWAMGQGLVRKRAVAFKTGTSYGYRDAWSAGFSNDYTVGVWVGRADGSPRAGHVGRESAAPILLKTFQLLPNDIHPDEPPPAGAILTNANDQLPMTMRVFRREMAPAPPKEMIVPPPTIAFPPNGSVVPLPTDPKDKTIVLKADGGKAPLTWLVNGELIGSFDRFQPVLFTPDGEGLARITVVDAQGRSDSSQVRFKKPKS